MAARERLDSTGYSEPARRRWLAARAVLVITIIVVVLGAVASLLGAGAPPRGARLRLDLPTLDGIASAPAGPGLTVQALGALPLPPFTVELGAANGGPAASAWGLWLGGTGGDWRVILLDNLGYMSVSGGETRDWQPFPHLRAGANALSLHVDASGQATLRLNGEVAWRGSVAAGPGATFGVARTADAVLTLEFARLWAG